MGRALCALAFGVAIFGSSSIASAQVFWSYSADGTACAKSIDSGGGQTWAIGCDAADANGNSAIWQRTSSGWVFVSGFRASVIRVSNQGAVWALTANRPNGGNIFKRVGNTWTQYPGCALSLDVGNADTDAWATGCDSGAALRVWRFNGTEWVQPQPAARGWQIAVAANNVAWLTTHDGSIWNWNGSSFVNVPGCASNIILGGNLGAGVVVGCDIKTIWRWDGTQFMNMWSTSPKLISFMATDGSYYTDYSTGQVYKRSVTIIH